MRQVYAFIARIQIRQHNNAAIQAGFHGIEIALKSMESLHQQGEFDELSEEQKQDLKAAALAAVERRKKINGKRKR